MIAQEIVVSSGCNLTTPPQNMSTSCATQDSFILDIQHKISISPPPCPAPRVGAVLVPNENTFSSAFASQVFLLLGTFNTSLWQDNNGLAQGEVVSACSQAINIEPIAFRLYLIQTQEHGPESYPRVILTPLEMSTFLDLEKAHLYCLFGKL